MMKIKISGIDAFLDGFGNGLEARDMDFFAALEMTKTWSVGVVQKPRVRREWRK